MKILHSVLVSFNIHVWLVVGLSTIWALNQSDPEPKDRKIEVQFFKISAAEVEGFQNIVASQKIVISSELKNTKTEQRHSVMVLDGTHSAKTGSPTRAFGDDKHRKTFKSRVKTNRGAHVISRKHGPSVTYKISLAKDGLHARYEARPTLDVVASPIVFSDKSGVSEPFNSSMPAYGGDIRPRIDIIQAKIDAVTPIMHRTSVDCWSEGGVVTVKFSMNHEGYPTGHRIVRSSGSNCLDKEVDTVLHMAEPYPYVAGWVPVTVKFIL
ncbi:MAG: energy transducer TonB [Deltaproteobacteria bacterium]|nr:energy transducer TonB [Deltaproteobacteria bacterium]